MTKASVHEKRDHQHGPGCGHKGIKHGDHVDYLHDGHLHHQEANGSVVEHVLPVSAANPDGCTHQSRGAAHGHQHGHVHGPNCGHDAVPHGDHVDYLVDGRLHHPHDGHCDDHGPVQLV